MKIVWDERKREANLAKHRLDFAEIDDAFFESAVFVAARSGRLIAIGWLAGATTVVFKPLGSEAVAIISVRPASIKERRLL